MAGWGDIPTGSKNNGLNQPKAREPCTMHCTCHKKLCRITYLASKQLQQFEQRVLQTGSSEGGLQWQREGQQPRSIRYTLHRARDLESTVAQGFEKHCFKVLLHRVVDGPLQASRCLVSRTPRVYTRYTPCILGLTARKERRLVLSLLQHRAAEHAEDDCQQDQRTLQHVCWENAIQCARGCAFEHARTRVNGVRARVFWNSIVT